MKPLGKTEQQRAEFIVKGCLTRLALMFQFSGRTFTGPEVANVILAAWFAHDKPEIFTEQEQLTEGRNA
jgi:hypothetical protein